MTISRSISKYGKVVVDGIEYTQNDTGSVTSSQDITMSMTDFVKRNRNTKVFTEIHKDGTERTVDLTDPKYWEEVDTETASILEVESVAEKYKLILEYKDYLSSTDYKVLPDYDKKEGLESVILKRQEARNTIRQLEKELSII